MRRLLGLFLLPVALGLAAPPEPIPVAPLEPDDPLAALSSRLERARQEFELALAAPADELDVSDATRCFDEALLELRWDLDRLYERGEGERPGSWRLLLESSKDELRLSWARLHEVGSVTPQIRALAHLDLEMAALLEEGHAMGALRLLDARLPEPLDPLDWPAVVRRRLRDVERLAQAARAKISEQALPR